MVPGKSWSMFEPPENRMQFSLIAEIFSHLMLTIIQWNQKNNHGDSLGSWKSPELKTA